MEVSKDIPKEKQKNLWKYVESNNYQCHVTISFVCSLSDSKETIEKMVYMDDSEKRENVYGICGECYAPGTGENWCQPCNAKRFKENLKNWTSKNKDIDELIQLSQLNAVHHSKYLEWIPFENFQNVTYITEGGLGKIYSANWPEGYLDFWDIENQNWVRHANTKVALKSLDSSDFTRFLNEINSHLQVYTWDITACYGVTQNPDTKNYMIVSNFCKNGNLRNYLDQSDTYIDFMTKIDHLLQISRALLSIHNAGKVHRNLNSKNILFDTLSPYIDGLGMSRPANDEEQSVKQGILPYMAPEVLCGHHYTKATDIYSFGIIMNEYLSEEIPYSEISFDEETLAVNICKGLRPKISEVTPKLLASLIMKCWDAKAENRPTAKELYQILCIWNKEKWNEDSKIHSQIKECEQIIEEKFENSENDSVEYEPKNIRQEIYTSKILNFKNLPEPVNSVNSSEPSTS